MVNLFSPLKIGAIELKHRVVMAPLTRMRASSGHADAVAFGSSFISNPDLVERIRHGAALNAWDRKTFYGGGEAGYTDYPALNA